MTAMGLLPVASVGETEESHENIVFESLAIRVNPIPS